MRHACAMNRASRDLQSVMYVSGMADKVIGYDSLMIGSSVCPLGSVSSKSAYQGSPGPPKVKERLVGIKGGGHLVPTDLCQPNAEGKIGTKEALEDGVRGVNSAAGRRAERPLRLRNHRLEGRRGRRQLRHRRRARRDAALPRSQQAVRRAEEQSPAGRRVLGEREVADRLGPNAVRAVELTRESGELRLWPWTLEGRPVALGKCSDTRIENPRVGGARVGVGIVRAALCAAFCASGRALARLSCLSGLQRQSLKVLLSGGPLRRARVCRERRGSLGRPHVHFIGSLCSPVVPQDLEVDARRSPWIPSSGPATAAMGSSLAPRIRRVLQGASRSQEQEQRRHRQGVTAFDL
jgi:hypothetical protein